MSATLIKYYRASVCERDIQAGVVQYLTLTGWVVVELSQYQRVTGTIVGMSDVIAWKGYGASTVCLLVECKSPTGRLRRSQEEFFERIKPLLSPTLWHFVVRSLDDLIDGLTVIEQANKENIR